MQTPHVHHLITLPKVNTALIRKYNIPGPRYTSYPTVPYWDAEGFSTDGWEKHVKDVFSRTNASEGISLYIHLPFCESLCTYCGCNKRITKNHGVEMPYIGSLLQEWAIYQKLFHSVPRISELHLGGGTPTFFSPENLRLLMNGLTNSSILTQGAELSFEAHPNNTTQSHLEELHFLGFRRLSLGVQDFDPEVQKAIHRIQPFANVKRVTDLARGIGYTSVNFDLIYGLPKQTKQSVRDTIDQTLGLMPDRIAFYSYAHVPWSSPSQRGYSEDDLPTDEHKRELYELGKAMFLEAGYLEIGMDHFALPDDSLSHADQDGTLHRNFMGYTTRSTHLMVGLGVSAISDAWSAFAQNEKTVEDYQKRVADGQLPVFRGHLLTEEDLQIRQHILNLMCRHQTKWITDQKLKLDVHGMLMRLTEPIDDGLVSVLPHGLEVTDKGRPFIRNICMALDERLWRDEPKGRIFSSTV
ncbi:MAG: oxygen-independent coproporphyrinogen III oxidase [Flavobacteriales bacterium]|nr:oxygen-independent coproporphyrinogen III oxidase [Flavobacteriales bacterium]